MGAEVDFDNVDKLRRLIPTERHSLILSKCKICSKLNFELNKKMAALILSRGKKRVRTNIKNNNRAWSNHTLNLHKVR